jgi:N-acetyl sugar amidotransferase
MGRLPNNYRTKNEPGNHYAICTHCIMDTSDPFISFDEDGKCSHCLRFEKIIRKDWHPDAAGEEILSALIARIKDENRHRDYDAAIGLSGGVDSSYLAYVAKKKYDLRLLAVHIDGGWNSELSVKNIEKIVSKLNIDLYTFVVDWEEMRDLQIAFLHASLANIDVPQDHAFIAGLYKYATKHKLRYVLSGGNIATESILPEEWAYNAMDLRHLKAIHDRFGKKKLISFPTLNFVQYYLMYPYVNKMRVVRPLNYLPYNRDDAIHTLEHEIGFRYYGSKHFESRFTKWQQLFYRPMKFGYDSRRAHLSSLIQSDQMSREDAIKEMEQGRYNEAAQAEDTEYVRKKLGLTPDEFDYLLSLPSKTYRDYPSNQFWFSLKNRLKDILGGAGFNIHNKF